MILNTHLRIKLKAKIKVDFFFPPCRLKFLYHSRALNDQAFEKSGNEVYYVLYNVYIYYTLVLLYHWKPMSAFSYNHHWGLQISYKTSHVDFIKHVDFLG